MLVITGEVHASAVYSVSVVNSVLYDQHSSVQLCYGRRME